MLELWNLVFIQFQREAAGGALRPLPARHVDTGMGLERLVAVLQARRSNYDTDLFAPLLAATAAATGAPPYAGRVGAADAACMRRDTAYRVVADHVRTLTVALADGAVIGNAGRGYVLRRVLRRAARYGRQMLGAQPGLLASLVPVAVASLEAAHPGLAEKLPLVQAAVAEEEAERLPHRQTRTA